MKVRDSIIRYLLVVCAMLVVPMAVSAQLTASKAFADAPREVFPMLTDLTRLDMIDYYASGTRTASRNLLDGESRIEEMSPVQMKVKMSDVSTYTITILPAGRDSVIAVAAEILTPVPDGYLVLYDRDWTPLDAKKFVAPTIDNWLLPSAKKIMADIENAVPFIPATYTIDPSAMVLTVTQNVSSLIPAEDYDKVKDYLRPVLRYRWTGSKMSPLKD